MSEDEKIKRMRDYAADAMPPRKWDKNTENLMTHLDARKLLTFLSEASKLIDLNSIDKLKDREYLKQLHEAKLFGESAAHDADEVKASLEALMQRLKTHTNDNPWYQSLLKKIDEYKDDPSSAPLPPGAANAQQEQYYDEKGWGQDLGEIVLNMNIFYGVVTIDGKTTIPHKKSNGQWEFMGLADFSLRFANKNMLKGDKLVSIDKVWIRSPGRRDIDEVIFDPKKLTDNPRVINLWNGFPTVARQSDCSVPLAYYRDIISSGNEDHYNFILDVLAHLVKKPWEKLEIAIVLIGLKGVGKTKFYEIIVRLIGPLYCFQTSNPEHVYSKFSKHLMNKLVMMLEEATWGGDKRHEGMLQDFITGKTHNIEIKNGPTITVDNLLRVIIDSNNISVVPASQDERRYAVFKVSDARRKDYEYFSALDKALDNGATEALMDFLKERDISRFNRRIAPPTMWLTEQIIENMPSLERWWLGVARLGHIRFLEEETKKLGHDWVCVGRQILYDSYCRAMKVQSPRARVLSMDEFGRQLRPLIPTIVDGKTVKESIVGKDGIKRGEKIISLIGEKRIGKDEPGGRMWTYLIPPLSVVREVLEFRLGELEWNEVEVWEKSEYDPF